MFTFGEKILNLKLSWFEYCKTQVKIQEVKIVKIVTFM